MVAKASVSLTFEVSHQFDWVKIIQMICQVILKLNQHLRRTFFESTIKFQF
jgi:hypothetical protein